MLEERFLIDKNKNSFEEKNLDIKYINKNFQQTLKIMETFIQTQSLSSEHLFPDVHLKVPLLGL